MVRFEINAKLGATWREKKINKIIRIIKIKNCELLENFKTIVTFNVTYLQHFENLWTPEQWLGTTLLGDKRPRVHLKLMRFS